MDTPKETIQRVAKRREQLLEETLRRGSDNKREREIDPTQTSIQDDDEGCSAREPPTRGNGSRS